MQATLDMTFPGSERSAIAKVPLTTVWRTLIDYENYPKILDEIVHARVLERRPHLTIVEFRAKVLFRRFDYTLAMHEGGHPFSLSWTLVQSRALRVNEGRWTLEALGARETNVTYRVHVVPSLPLPEFFVRGVTNLTLPKMVQKWARYAERSEALDA